MSVNIDDLTLGQIKQLTAFTTATAQPEKRGSVNYAIGKYVIIRTYSAGVWCGYLSEQNGSEVIITSARRLYRWWAAQSISLSAVAIHGIKHDKSKIVEPVESIWLNAIEVIPCTDVAWKSLKEAPHVKAE